MTREEVREAIKDLTEEECLTLLLYLEALATKRHDMVEAMERAVYGCTYDQHKKEAANNAG